MNGSTGFASARTALPVSNEALRAVIYLRVSSQGQVKTDYDPEGLSIPAQREACERKARELGAVIVREYVEPGVSGGSILKRKAFRQMIAETRQREDVDYVIVWSVSRWARDQEDHWTARGLITRAGAKLISVKEPIGEDTAHGVMLEGVMAAVAAARRIEISEEVTRGIDRKLKVGGTPGRAPIGYLNIREKLPDGGEVRTVVIDPERAPVVRWAFTAYATGLYSLHDLVGLLEARGLVSLGTRRFPSRPLSASTVNDMLRNPYYVGEIRYKGKVYPGRHEPLIDRETFDKVQGVLESHMHSGERDRKHQHFLKGTIRCGTCGRRLVYSRNKGNGGIYEYFICSQYQLGKCPQRPQPVDLVEGAIENYYATVELTKVERDEVRLAVRRHLGEMAEAAELEIQGCNSTLSALKDEERKLLELHYQDRISAEVYDEDRARILRKRENTEGVIASLRLRYRDIADTLDLAFEVLKGDLQECYLKADDTIRRLINQAIFKALYVCDEDITRADLTPPFAALRQFYNDLRAASSDGQDGKAAAVSRRQRADLAAESAKGPAPDRGTEPLDVGLINEAMVELGGFEPPTSWVRSRRSAS